MRLLGEELEAAVGVETNGASPKRDVFDCQREMSAVPSTVNSAAETAYMSARRLNGR